MMNQRNTRLLRTAAVLVGLLGVLTMSASAMHIAEGYLPVGWPPAGAWYASPLWWRASSPSRRRSPRPPRPKSCWRCAERSPFCSPPTGVGLGAILFGPMTMAVLGLIVLLFQALLLAHGGLTTLGANTFSMAIAGPIVSWAVYKLLRKANAPAAVAVFAAAALGDLFTYVVTSVQLGVVNGGIGKFLMVFAVTQIPLAIAEGLLTVVVFNVLEKYSREELHALCVL